VWRLSTGERSFYSEREGAGGHGHGDGGGGATGDEGARRGRREVAGIMAILECVRAQRKGDGMARDASASVTGPAEVVDEDDGDRARGRERACLAASWCLGDATGER
jgi:hypothetical protein